MTHLVENLLSLARKDGGAEAIASAPIRLNYLFGQVAEQWRNAMNQALLDFQVEMPEENLVMLGDSHSISRLLSILLENASRYTPPGGAVKVSADVDGERIVLSVQDTGIGIAHAHKLRIFDRFYRIAPPHESVSTGSGLGLALGKWIAERHGTELCVESEPGRGSCFFFSLKRINTADSAIGTFGTTQAEAELNPPLTHPA
jgi:signal transduction histidine kinase